MLKKWLTTSPAGRTTIPFSEPAAVFALNKALLKHHYGVDFWTIPKGNLCPPIPGRMDYIHYLADLLAESNAGKLPYGQKVKGLDIGVGANCIYPLLAAAEYQWQLVGSDIQEESIKSASSIIDDNPAFIPHISLRHQTNKDAYFDGIIAAGEKLTFTMCNPPFHRSAKEATEGTARKNTNLAKNKVKRGNRQEKQNPPQSTSSLNFAGNAAELWCDGGELAFIKRMAKESKRYADQVLWFTCLVSKSEHLKAIKKQLAQLGVAHEKVVEMRQGNKVSRFIAWTYQPVSTHTDWFSS